MIGGGGPGPGVFTESAPPPRWDELSLKTDHTSFLSRLQNSGNSQRIMTFSAFIKPPVPSLTFLYVFKTDTDAIYLLSNPPELHYDGTGFAVNTFSALTTGQWNHICIQIDTTQATAADRVRLWMNGIDLTDVGGSTFPTLNQDTNWGASGITEIIGDVTSAGLPWLIDEVARVDGTVVAQSVFADGADIQDLAQAGISWGQNGWWLRFETGVAATAGISYPPAPGNNFSNNGYTEASFSHDTGALAP